jgi:hypothetical protein
MAYAKTLIGNVTKGANHKRGDKRLQQIVDTVDANLTNIEAAITDIAVEATADLVGAMVTGNTETGITVTYQDADNTLDFEVSAEYIADTVGAMVTGNTETGIAVTYDDADNTLDFVLGAHAHTASAGDGAVLTGYQATPFASTLTLTQMGIVPPVAPSAWAGTAMAALTGASTFQQLLDAISTDIATAGT